jgi:hypothetical protein
MDSAEDVATLPATGFPIQKSPDQNLFSSSPKLIAAFHVFHRLLTPRHPPFALNSLATKYLTQILRTHFFRHPNCQRTINQQCSAFLVEVNGFEPMTFPLTKRDALADSSPPPTSRGTFLMVEVNGFEPMTSCVQGRRSPS